MFALTKPAHFQQEIRKSRFLAQAGSVGSPAQALAFVQQMGDPAATHNAWAYAIGQDYRFNDDGEVGGTAGRPILQAIEAQGLDRIAVVITRWYGGTKLGAGGLSRAYGGTAAECLRLAEREPIVATTQLRLHAAFADLPLLKARLVELGAELDSETFDTQGAALEFHLPSARADEAESLIGDISRGRSEARRVD